MSAGRSTDDATLAARMAAGEHAALNEVYERWGRTTFGFLISVLGDRSAAEDVQQQVYLDVWRAAERYDRSRGSLLTWIIAIARNRAIDHGRRRVPVPSGVLEEQVQHDSGDTPEGLAERWHIAGLLARLHPEERKVLRLRFYEDLTQREIAERMGMPLGTVKMRMVSGLENLRDMMGESR